jgi:hypothetical protein
MSCMMTINEEIVAWDTGYLVRCWMISLILPLRPSDWKSVIGSKGFWSVGGGIGEVVEGEEDEVGTGDHRESEAIDYKL